MFPGYKNIINTIGLKSLIRPVERPLTRLAIGDDDERSNVPLVIFRDQHMPMPGPTVPNIMDFSYEQLAKNGAGDSLAMEDFVTDDFNLGEAYDFLM